MVNYQQGKIYKLISEQTNDIYVGSTTNHYLCVRLAGHTLNFNRWETNKSKTYCTSYEIIKYEDHKIILIENFPCNSKDELTAREQYWIDKLGDNCVNKKRAHGRAKKSNDAIKYNAAKYYIAHKETILNKAKELKVCECGSEVRVNGLNRHLKTDKHMNFVNQIVED